MSERARPPLAVALHYRGGGAPRLPGLPWRCEARSGGGWSSRMTGIWPLSDLTLSMIACGAVSEASSGLRRRRLGAPPSELPPYLANSSATVRCCVRSEPPS